MTALLALLALVAAATADVGMVPTSPEDVCPILIGAQVPDVKVASLDGRPVELRSVVTQQPTILVYYRGGW